MNKENLKGNWKELHRRVKDWWGQLNDNDLDQIRDRYEPLVGKLQKRYGYTRREAQDEVLKFLAQVND